MSTDNIHLEVNDNLLKRKLETIEDFEQLAIYLEAQLNGPKTTETNGEIYFKLEAETVDTVRGLKIQIYPDEHPPPHFHVRSGNIQASFSIKSCELLEGEVSSRNLKIIREWYPTSKRFLIDKWNSTRPYDCTVGPYRE